MIVAAGWCTYVVIVRRRPSRKELNGGKMVKEN